MNARARTVLLAGGACGVASPFLLVSFEGGRGLYLGTRAFLVGLVCLVILVATNDRRTWQWRTGTVLLVFAAVTIALAVALAVVFIWALSRTPSY